MLKYQLLLGHGGSNSSLDRGFRYEMGAMAVGFAFIH